jgi:sec-independent protein translocase protein TatB
MFDIGWGELLLIGVVALIAIGPKELPGTLRAIGQWMGKIRRMAADFQSQFHEAMREAEMADLKQQVETLTSGFDPIETARREIESAAEDKPPSALATSTTEATTSPDTPSAYAAPVEPGSVSGEPSVSAEPTGSAAATSEPATAGAEAATTPGDRPA